MGMRSNWALLRIASAQMGGECKAMQTKFVSSRLPPRPLSQPFACSLYFKRIDHDVTFRRILCFTPYDSKTGPPVTQKQINISFSSIHNECHQKLRPAASNAESDEWQVLSSSRRIGQALRQERLKDPIRKLFNTVRWHWTRLNVLARDRICINCKSWAAEECDHVIQHAITSHKTAAT